MVVSLWWLLNIDVTSQPRRYANQPVRSVTIAPNEEVTMAARPNMALGKSESMVLIFPLCEARTEIGPRHVTSPEASKKLHTALCCCIWSQPLLAPVRHHDVIRSSPLTRVKAVMRRTSSEDRL
jgi:hypothetical protein